MPERKPAVVTLDDLTEAATAGVLRALEGRAGSRDILRGPIIIGIVMQPPELLQGTLNQQLKQ